MDFLKLRGSFIGLAIQRNQTQDSGSFIYFIIHLFIHLYIYINIDTVLYILLYWQRFYSCCHIYHNNFAS